MVGDIQSSSVECRLQANWVAAIGPDRHRHLLIHSAKESGADLSCTLLNV